MHERIGLGNISIKGKIDISHIYQSDLINSSDNVVYEGQENKR
jgi:hypothetical protein